MLTTEALVADIKEDEKKRSRRRWRHAPGAAAWAGCTKDSRSRASDRLMGSEGAPVTPGRPFCLGNGVGAFSAIIARQVAAP